MVADDAQRMQVSRRRRRVWMIGIPRTAANIDARVESIVR
jgi:hypothetical protein